jgi:hypothetical protein
MQKITFKLICGILVIMLLASCSVLRSYKYWSPETKFVVVDAQTNEPIEGAIVLANWPVKYVPFLVGEVGGRTDSVAFFEGVTNAEGVIKFPSWGPKYADWGVDIDRSGPIIRIFKQGYKFLELRNSTYFIDHSKSPNYDSPLPSDWNNKVVKLEPFKGGGEEYAWHLMRFQGSLMSSGIPCLHNNAVRMLKELHRMKAYFESNKIRNYLIQIPRKCAE